MQTSLSEDFYVLVNCQREVGQVSISSEEHSAVHWSHTYASYKVFCLSLSLSHFFSAQQKQILTFFFIILMKTYTFKIS